MTTDHEKPASSPMPDGPVVDESAQPSNQKPGPRAGQPRRHLSMSVVNFWLDAFLMTLVVAIGWVSATLRIVFPPPTRADGWKLWGWTFDQWSDIQFACLCVLGLGVVVHVMLHWNWVCGVIANQIIKSRGRIDDSMKTIYGVGLLIFLLHVIAAGVITAMYCVQHPPL